MRYLWAISAVMILLGIALSLARLLAVASPIAVVAGVLLIWSGAIKIVVLRIWQATLPSAASATPPTRVAPGITERP